MPPLMMAATPGKVPDMVIREDHTTPDELAWELAAERALVHEDAPARFVATVNVPGYLPEDDEPPTFENATAAWDYLAHERERDEDSAEYADGDPAQFVYSDTWRTLCYIASGGHAHGDPLEDTPTNADGTGVVYGSTPGSNGPHDLGLAYCVTRAV